jgi:amino acid adenylation domain-containing protein
MVTRTTINKYIPVDHNPFGVKEIQRVVPSIEPQIEIFTSCMLGGEDASRCYNESVSLQLSGSFNKSAMFRALQDIVSRHELLRATFSADGTQVFIQKSLDLKILFEDVSGKEVNHENWISDFKSVDAHTTFDLLNGPLFRVALFRLAEHEHYLTLSAHHIICDGWSLGILMQELSKLYSAYAKGDEPSLTEAPLFSTYAIDQWNFSQSDEFRKIKGYWTEQFKNDIPVLNVPTDYPWPNARTYKSTREDFKIDPTVVASIKALGIKSGCSFVTTFLSLFELYLHRLTNQDDIVVGMPAAGQSVTGNHGLIGHCVNLLPLRSRLEEGDDFNQFLKKQKRSVLDAFDHQLFTFSSLLKELPIPRDPSRVPLVPIVFNIDMGMDAGVKFHGLQHQLISNPRAFETFEIFLNATGSEQTMVLEWSYNTNLFKSATIQKMMRDFEGLISEVIQNPRAHLRNMERVNIETPEEKFITWDTAADYPKNKTVHQLIMETAAQYADNLAVSFDGYQLTYQKLNEKSNQLAALLIQQGVRTGDTIGLAVERSHQMVIALLAIMKAGAAYIPIDPDYPEDRIQFMLADACPKILLTSKKYKGRYARTSKQIFIEEIWPKLKHFSKTVPTAKVEANDLAYILYTSGSTGKPKGVKILHKSLVNFLSSFRKIFAITPGDKMIGLTTLSFDISGLELYLPLISGASVNILPKETAKDGRLLLDAIKSIRPTIMQATPGSWQMLLDAGWNEDSIIKTICSGGESLSLDLSRKLHNRCKNLYNLYGPTETTIWSTAKKLDPDTEIITIGKPIDNTQVYILDESLTHVKQNTIGEIYIAGEGVAEGYLNRPELSMNRFIPDPFSNVPGTKMYRTGDLGKILANGDIQCFGRIDQQVKIRGHRIEPGEIEHHLNQEVDVKTSVVIAKGAHAGDQKLVAYVVPKGDIKMISGKSYQQNVPGFDDGNGHYFDFEGKKEVITRWKSVLKKSLPLYMVPNDFVILSKLPFTPNGKVDRNALPDPGYCTNRGKSFVAPRNNNEKMIADIWCRFLKIEKVSIQDDFFEIGGHSFIAVQMMVELEKKTGIRVPPAILFESSTIEKLAAKFETNNRGFIWKSLVPVKASGTKMPIYIVHGVSGHVLFFNKLEKYVDRDQPIYGLQAKGLNGEDKILQNVEDMAKQYITEILQQNPDGPYMLGGYCFGGIIAYEMAQQLKAKGKEVRMLALFETYIDSPDESNTLLEKVARRTKLFLMQRLHTLSLFIKDPRSKLKYERDEMNKSFRIIYRKIKMFFGSYEKDTVYYKFQIEKQNKKAGNRYKFAPYDGTLDLFRCEKHSFYIKDFEFLGWKPYAKNINVHQVPGDHNSIFSPPYSSAFGNALQRCLDDASEEKNKKSFQKGSMLRAV